MKANKLINEKSPYLLQHAYNPVDWYPWCDEAFNKAKEEDKPIFLSIGYSTCHWCHVMEKESFEDDEVAQKLNDGFISIKVDREERPDIDSIYMTFCQATTGSGGWPLTIIMTPDKKPFFAGTYFSKNNKYGRIGLLEILQNIEHEWINNKESLISSSDKITMQINEYMLKHKSEELEDSIIKEAYLQLRNSYDEKYGGFNMQPKFPTAHKLMFLLRVWKLYGYEEALEMVENTLIHMYKGGIFDHIGYGFSRYSTDRKWLVPHFEKMLYDNALLALVYAETYNATKKKLYKDISEKTLNYILKTMTSKDGGFYSAEDADSEGIEGKFYLWTLEEIINILGEEEGKIFANTYDISAGGNFEGSNIPNLINRDLDENFENHIYKLEKSREKLFNYRDNRIHPFKDDKILTSWNSLAIVALAYGGRIFNNEGYVKSAEKALEFIMKNLINKEGRLLARYREGESANLGYIDDYAFLVWALIELYEATFKVEYLKKAIHFNRELINLFSDKEGGGFFLYGKDSEKLIFKPKETYDGAIPSGNSVALYNISRLLKITEDEGLENLVSKAFNDFGGKVKESLESHAFFLISFMFMKEGNGKIVIVGNFHHKDTLDMLCEINERFLPFYTILLKDKEEELQKISPYIEGHSMINNKTSIYLCDNNSCHEPVNNKDDLRDLLDKNK